MTEACFDNTTVSRIKFEEKGRCAVILNPDREEYTRARVDGCLIRDALAADWVVTKPDIGDVVIELKGSDVDHAIDQITATIDYWISERLRCGKLSALIVCAKYPKVDTKVQRAKSKFARAFKAPLHIVSRNHEYSFLALLSPRGPLKE